MAPKGGSLSLEGLGTMQAQAGEITPDAVRRQLERMIVSDVFRGSPQLASFLHYIVEAVLQGKTDRIKGYTIGVEVLRRDTKFDPQVDPIVRVEAGRLRRAIDRYYAGPGIGDEVVIEVPRGSYVPTFQRAKEVAPQPLSAAPASPTASAPAVPTRLIVTVAAGLAAAVLLAVYLWPLIAPRTVSTPTPPAATLAANGMPVLAVTPFESSGLANDRVVAAPILREKLREAFASFEAINVVLDGPSEAHVNFRFAGLTEYHDDGTVSLRFRLTDVRNNTLVWTRTFTRLAPARDREATEESIVADVSNTLLRPYGIVRSYARSRALAGEAIDPRYQCILFSSDAIRSYDQADHTRSRTCLEALTAQDPGFSDGFAYLAILLNRDFLFGTGEAAAPLDRSLRAARRAVELKPNSSRAHHAMAIVLFYRGDLSASFAEFERAIELNRYDSAVRTDFGSRLVMSGEVDRGLNLLLAGLPDDGIIRASWQHFGLLVAYYAKGDLAAATRQAELASGEQYPYRLAVSAAVAVRNGNIVAAREIADRLVALRPAWRADPDGEFRRMIPDANLRARLVADLKQAGLGAN